MLLPLAIGIFRLRVLTKQCQSMDNDRIYTLFISLKRQLGIRRSVRLLQTFKREMPMTWGIFRSVLLLPCEAQHWSKDRLRAVLCHELAHIQRQDCLTQLLALIVRALYWFHPLVWWTVAKLCMDQEQACDDVVLSTNVKPTDYAEHLLALTARCPSMPFSSTVALAMSRASRLERRLLAMLENRNRQTLPSRSRWFVLIALLALGTPLAMLSLQSSASAQGTTTPKSAEVSDSSAVPGLQQLTELESVLQHQSLKALTKKEIFEGAMQGILQKLNDPHSEYLSADRLAQLRRSIQGNITGIGVRLGMNKGQLTVLTPLPGSPALKAGVNAKDAIMAIDGKPTKGQALAEVVQRIIGKQGTKVKLTLKRGTQNLDVSITRDRVKVPSVAGFHRMGEKWNYLLDKSQKVGYIHISQFASDTAKDLQQAIGVLKKQGMKGLILDLRFCPGGQLDAAVKTCDLFLSKGQIVTVKGNKVEKRWKASKGSVGDFPMIILVNEATASAAEIVAGALRDNDRAMLMGERSFGKGSVQALISLSKTGGAVKLTTARHFLPSGRNIDRTAKSKSWGVDPHDGYYLPLSQEAEKALIAKRELRKVITTGKGKAMKVTPKSLEENESDPQLAAALKSMLAKLNKGKFTIVGKGKAALEAEAERQQALKKRRDTLLKQLAEINKQIGSLRSLPEK